MLMQTNGSVRARNGAAAAAIVIAAGGAGAMLVAYFFQYVLKYQPCPLCLDQRVTYYVGIPLAVLIAIAAWRQVPRALVMLGFVALTLAMLSGAAIAAYHAGVEWHWWAGPQDCSGNALPPSGNLLEQLNTVRIVRCDEAPWRLFGMSLAGYNVLVSLALAAVALWGLRASIDYGSSTVSQ